MLFLLSYLLEIAGLSFGIGQILTSLVLQSVDHSFPPATHMNLTDICRLPNSRTHELEADKLGLFYSARACYDPRGAPEYVPYFLLLSPFFMMHQQVAIKIKLLGEAEERWIRPRIPEHTPNFRSAHQGINVVTPSSFPTNLL